jgi:hypothetical protein
VFYAGDDFGGRRTNATPETVHANFTDTLSRARPKELAHDYLEREHTPDSPLLSGPAPSPANDLDARQQAAAERWAARQQHGPNSGHGTDRSNSHAPSQHPERTLDRRRDGPEDDFLP